MRRRKSLEKEGTPMQAGRTNTAANYYFFLVTFLSGFLAGVFLGCAFFI